MNCDIYVYSHPQIDGKVNHHQISRDLLFHLFGDDYRCAFYIKKAKKPTGSEGLTFCLLIFRAAWVWEKYPIVRPFKWVCLKIG